MQRLPLALCGLLLVAAGSTRGQGLPYGPAGAPGAFPYFIPGGAGEVVPAGVPMPPPDVYQPGPGPIVPPNGVAAAPEVEAPWLGGWLDVEYMLWFLRDDHIRTPLASTGTPESLGVLGTPGAFELPGATNLNYSGFAGMRLRGGIPVGGRLSLEGSFFLLEQRSAGDSFLPTNPAAVLARPFFDINTGEQSSRVLVLPGVAQGGLIVRETNRLWGLEVGPAVRVRDGGTARLDLMAGYRFINLNEALFITDSTTSLNDRVSALGGVVTNSVGQVIQVQDRFSTDNDFNGAQLGARIGFAGEHVAIGLTGKVAVGWVHQELQVFGASADGSVTGQPSLGPPVLGGLLASDGVLGTRSRDVFTWVPEGILELNWCLCGGVNVTVGYTFLYIPNVIRPGQVVDPRVNPTFVPSNVNFGANFGPRVPPPLNDTNFWAHGFSVGLSLTY
jgi:hypothetical protein